LQVLDTLQKRPQEYATICEELSQILSKPHITVSFKFITSFIKTTYQGKFKFITGFIKTSFHNVKIYHWFHQNNISRYVKKINIGFIKKKSISQCVIAEIEIVHILEIDRSF
jgi:hypothetical protein